MPKQISPQIVGRLKIASQILSLLVSLTGFLALVGWQFDVTFLKRIVPSLPVIAPNTATAFFVGGIVLFSAVHFTAKKKYTNGILYFFSVAIALLGLLTLLEYIFKISFGIDRLLFAAAQGGNAVKMSPQSAFNFLMVGISLFFIIDQRKKENVKVGQVIVLLAGAVSLFSLFGFIYSIPSFYTIAPYKGMAAHTAVAFVMTFSGILLAFPEIGFMRIFAIRSPSGMAARRLFATLVFILAAEIFVALGRKSNIFEFNSEALLHLLILAVVFVYLIFFAFRSLDELGKMETSLAKSRELEQAKTEFVSLASHQLRTPLTAVSWYTEMLLGKDVGKLNDKQENYLHEIYAGNQRMIDLVDDLLNSSRIDMGTLEIKPQSIDLRAVSDGALNEFLPQIRQKNMVIEKKYSRNLPSTKLDPELIGIVFQNLISNAVKYTPAEGKISIEIKRQNSHILIKIADNGWGIPENQQKKIFTKLFRADNVRKKDTEGTGLGLYIAKAIVRQSKGKIWFDSKEKRGTTFYIILPVK
jgi:signal transduction histidine kinase